jgi:outer membrane protein OmpA-like peptidoglycan-associated protein
VGHADTRGEYSKGYVLGLKRSGVVRDKLVKCGCPTELLLTSSKGGESPISGMKTVEERAKNRRVEITILSE